jgi:hypothetical protein
MHDLIVLNVDVKCSNMNEVEILMELKDLIQSIRIASWCMVGLILLGTLGTMIRQYKERQFDRMVDPPANDCLHRYERLAVNDPEADPRCVKCGGLRSDHEIEGYEHE